MQDIKIARDCCVPKQNIKFYAAYESNMIKSEIRNRKKNTDTVKDFTRGRKINTVIFLISGEVLLTNLTLETITARMNQAEKSYDGKTELAEMPAI